MSTINPPRPTGASKPTTAGKPRQTPGAPAGDDQTRFAKALEQKRSEDGGKSGPAESRESLFRGLRQAREQGRGAPRSGQGALSGSPDQAPVDHDPSTAETHRASAEDMLRALHQARDDSQGGHRPGPGPQPGSPTGAPVDPNQSPTPAHLPSAQDILRGLRQSRHEEGPRADRKEPRAIHDNDEPTAEGGLAPGTADSSLPALSGGQRGDSDGEGDDRDGDTPDERDGDPDPAQVRSPADVILAGFKQRLDEVAPSKPADAAERPQATFSELVRDVAERILVGESGPAGQQEVRIVLKDEVLGGTEVRITEHEGAVQVTFVAGTKDAEQLLEAQREGISRALGERLDRDVRVEVTDREHADAQPQNDGRSRNRRSVPDERED